MSVQGSRLPVSALARAALIAVALASAATDGARASSPAASARPGAASPLPDWSGVWQQSSGYIFDPATADPPGGVVGAPGVRMHPPYTPEWEAKYAAKLATAAAGSFPDPLTTCGAPPGWPRLLNLTTGYEFVVRPEQTWIISESGSVMRIYTDNRTHPAPDDIWLTYSGDSVGHWEGAVLVFDTIALLGDPKTILDRTGGTLSDRAHTHATMRKIKDDTLEVALTIEDPVALTRPWTVTRTFRRLEKGARIYDYACAENNRNPVDAQGRTLTLDAEGKVIDKR